MKALVVAGLLLASRAEAALTEVASFGSNPGALAMYEYVPAELPTGRPLVVVMHGCTQTASSMEAAGWEALADQYKFAVLYPQQSSANQALSCFDWYTPADITRGQGEAASVAAMVDQEIASHGVDPQRVYVTGLSAGAAFTAVMLAAYPDRFAAGSIMSGLPYECATDLTATSGCEQMTSASQKTAAQWGDLVRAADSAFTGTRPRVQIWQGTMDFTVYPANATELVKQWTDVWGIDQTASATDTISTAMRTQYKSADTVAVELYLVTGMGHAVATGMDALGACPATTGAYFSDEKICSTLRAAQFFDLLGDATGSAGSGSGSSAGSSSGDDDPMHDGGFGCHTSGSSGAAMILVVLAALRRRR